MNTVFNNIICNCDGKDIHSYTEEQKSVKDIIDNLWLISNQKNSKVNLKKKFTGSSKIQVLKRKFPKLNLAPSVEI